MKNSTDLFEHYDKLPEPVQEIIGKYSEIENYQDCELFLKELKQLGYSFEYGLDAVPYNLRKIK